MSHRFPNDNLVHIEIKRYFWKDTKEGPKFTHAVQQYTVTDELIDNEPKAIQELGKEIADAIIKIRTDWPSQRDKKVD